MERVGIIDIGSNTVRLVVYNVESRLPIPMFNEKATCRLGAGLAETGKLNPKGANLARNSIDRFVQLARAMEVSGLSIVATAAVRAASDGKRFINDIEKICGKSVEIISGEEEARLASIGILNGLPNREGVLCDLGGGSLDIVLMDADDNHSYATAQLGHIVLHERSGGKINKAKKIIDNDLDDYTWLSNAKGRPLFAVGGAIRALAKLYIRQTNYPIHVVDGLVVRSDVIQDFLKLLSRQSPASLSKLPFVSSKRVETLPTASLVLGRLLKKTRAKEVVFSAFGMREGKMLSMLPERDKNLDPLIAAAEVMGKSAGRFSVAGHELYRWISPIFSPDTEEHDRCRLAACLLSDICWNEHPDYRSEHAFERTLTLPVAGLNHAQRVFLALSIYIRYGGDISDEIVKPVLSEIDEDALLGAIVTGQAIRLGHVVAGSAPGLLDLTYLERTERSVVLGSKQVKSLVQGEVVERRIQNLAKSLNLDFEIET